MGLASLMARGVAAVAAVFGLAGGKRAEPPPQSVTFGPFAIEAWPGHYLSNGATGWTPPRGAFFASKGKARWKRARRVRG